ncbi:MAG: hypothetical protein QM756_38780 [Polyangiaceae bacterium]
MRLESLADDQGTVTIGCVGNGVLYAGYEGMLSARLGEQVAEQVERFASASASLQFFVDASALTQYDMVARSAFVRVVLAHRRRFAALLMLNWTSTISPAGRALVTLLGEPSEIVSDPDEFQHRIAQAAPHARQMLAQRLGYRRLEARTRTLG